MKPALPPDEAERLEVLRRYQILDTEPEREFDDLTFLAAQICGTPFAAITMIDAERQWLKSSAGSLQAQAPLNMAREHSLCAHTILGNDLLLIPNALEDERSVDNPLVTSAPNIRFYAGFPLSSPEGHAVGALCVTDTVPRNISEGQREALRRLGHQVAAHLQARARKATTEELRAHAFRDEIAPQNQVEAQLQFQAHLLDTVGEAIIAINLEDTITYWNSSAETLYGWTASEAIGSDAATLIVPVAQREHALQVMNEMARGKVWSGDFTALRRDGTLIPVMVSNSPIYDEARNLVGFVGVSRDISDRKQAEFELWESEERHRLLLESVHDYAIYMLDPQGKVASWNAGAQRLKGYAAGEILGQSVARFYPPADIESGQPQKAIERAKREGRFEEEGWRVRKNGERFWANIVMTAVRDGRGVLRGFSEVTRDITERKNAQEALERSNREIRTIWESMTDAFSRWTATGT